MVPFYFPYEFKSLSNDKRAVRWSCYAHISRSSVFPHYSLKLVRLIHCNNVAVRYFSRLSDRGLVGSLSNHDERDDDDVKYARRDWDENVVFGGKMKLKQ